MQCREYVYKSIAETTKVFFVMFCLFRSFSCYSQGLRNDLILLKPITFIQKLPGTFATVVPIQGKNASFIPANFYTCNFGFFCRQELKMQQVHIPLVFRVGSMDYCNYLEQKPGYK